MISLNEEFSDEWSGECKLDADFLLK